jgi:multicomponent Na+:H+ antiporter subunit E
VIRAFGLAVFLAAAWLLLSGHFDPLILGLGAASCVLVVVIARRMVLIDREGFPIDLTWRLPVFWVWLVWQIVLSNIAVVRRIFARPLAIFPRSFGVEAGQPDDLGQVIYANSITLTPGTISLRLHDGRIEVHALDENFANDLLSGEMERRVRRLDGRR